MSAANKDEALTCARIARDALSAAPPDTARAVRFAEKAARLYACPETTAVLLRAQAMAAEAEARAARGAGGAAGASGSGSGSGGGGGGGAPAAAAAAAAAATNGAAAGGMRHRHQQHAGTQSAGDGPARAPSGPAPTQEQVALVAAILRARTHYEVLSVPRGGAGAGGGGADDEDAIKRAYRRLALRLHPDKCRAPRAEEAFKAVSRAFSVLSDPDKRAYYDRTGHDSHAAAASAAAAEQQQRRRQQQQQGARYAGANGGGGRRGYYATDEIDPDEIFNMFFGGNPFGGGVRAHTVYRTYGAGARGGAAGARGRPPQPGAAAADAAAARAGLASLAQLLPLLLVVFLTLFSSRPEPAYVLSPGGDGGGGAGSYREGLATGRLGVPFYVRSASDFARRYPDGSRARLRVDREIEGDYYDKTHVRCQHELLSRQRLAAWGGRAARERAAAMATPFCDELASLNARLSAGGRY
jgi:DnaJ family protein B protein 12